MKKFILKQESSHLPNTDYKLPYRDLLNAAQLKAVFFDEGAALVAAGAGTGKTRTLVYRVARLIESGVNPSEILLLTFTRRAANEMLRRAGDILDNRCLQVRGGTFHFYCSQLLHRYAERIGYPNNFTIADTADALEIIQFVRSTMLKKAETKRFPNKNTLLNIFSSSVNKNIDIRAVVLNEYYQFHEQIGTIEEILAGYTAYKEKNSVMDFDDLLVKTKQLLAEHEDIGLAVAGQNRFVMIDEYQDTNKIQAELAALFSGVHHNIMAVGDDAQSIYSFRGAVHRNIMEFPVLFENAELIKLEENYRSTPQILEVANFLIQQAHQKFDKKLYTGREDGEKTALVPCPSNRDQTRFVTQMALTLREQGTELNRTAVLFRNSRDSYDLELELRRKNIPFVKYGGQKFTEAAHLKDVLAHVRVVVNPFDTMAWNRILTLLDGIGPKTAHDMYEWIIQAADPYRLDLYETVSKSYLSQLKELSRLLAGIKDNKKTIPEIISEIVDYYKKFCQNKYDDYPKRLKDLEAFINLSVNFSSLPNMLEELALDPINATAVDTEAGQKDEEPLVLSTIHSAKGLEWQHVFIIHCLDGIIPSAYAADDEEQLDEELRLLYVATTRAEDMLYYCYPVLGQSGYGEYFTQISRFLENIPDGMLEKWQLVEEQETPYLPESADEHITG